MGNSNYALNAELKTLYNIKLNVQKGSVICIAGRADLRKTKIVKMLAGVIKPEEGFIDFGGLNWLNDDVEIKRKASFIYDHINFSLQAKPERIVKDIMAVEDNFDYQYFTEEMDKIHLDKKIRVNKYSYDMNVILKVLIAISRRPEIIVLDEPFDNIDFEYRDILLNLLKEFMQEENHTIIFTHDAYNDSRENDGLKMNSYNDFNYKLKEFCDEIIVLETEEAIYNKQNEKDNDFKADDFTKEILDTEYKVKKQKP